MKYSQMILFDRRQKRNTCDRPACASLGRRSSAPDAARLARSVFKVLATRFKCNINDTLCGICTPSIEYQSRQYCCLYNDRTPLKLKRIHSTFEGLKAG